MYYNLVDNELPNYFFFLKISEILSFIAGVLITILNVMRHNACLVINPITVGNCVSLFNCMQVVVVVVVLGVLRTTDS